MPKTLISKVALRSRQHGTEHMLAVRQRRDLCVARNRPVLESAKTPTSARAELFSIASMIKPASPVTPQYIPLTGLELFLADNPALKPFLLAGPARERAMNESAIAWAEICDRVYHLIRGQICVWHTGILGTMQTRMARWRGVTGSSKSSQNVKTDLLIDETSNTRESQDGFVTFDIPQSFVHECMPFFSVFGERVQEKSGYEIDLEDLRMKGEYEKVSMLLCLPSPYLALYAI